MSLLEQIAKRSTVDSTAFSLPDLLAERALAELTVGAPTEARTENERLNLIIAEHFTVELMRDGLDNARRYTDLLLEHGISERRFLGTIVPNAAAALGRGWEEDTISFADVTHASGQLMAIAREVMTPPPVDALKMPGRPRVLLMRTPGEDHTLGMTLAAQEMRRAGWLVRIDLSGEPAALTAACTAQEFDVIGFTVSSLGLRPNLSASIRQVRRLQPKATVVTGGLLGNEDNARFAAEVGADLSLGRTKLAVETLARNLSLSCDMGERADPTTTKPNEQAIGQEQAKQ